MSRLYFLPKPQAIGFLVDRWAIHTTHKQRMLSSAHTIEGELHGHIQHSLHALGCLHANLSFITDQPGILVSSRSELWLLLASQPNTNHRISRWLSSVTEGSKLFPMKYSASECVVAMRARVGTTSKMLLRREPEMNCITSAQSHWSRIGPN